MKLKSLIHLGSCIIAIVLVYVIILICPFTISDSEKKVIKGIQQKTSGYYPNLTQGDQSEIDFISSIRNEDQLTIFGSSEFSSSPYCPYNFLPHEFGIPALGLGHQFHQELSILGELCAANDYLYDSKVSIIISPGWFNTPGTNSSAFIEFLRPNFLKRIALDSTLSEEYKSAIGKFIHEKYNEFEGVSYEMDVLRERYLSAHGMMPEKMLSNFRSFMRNKYAGTYTVEEIHYEVEFSETERITSQRDLNILADSLQSDFINGISSNELYVYDKYFEKHLLKGDGTVKSGKFKPVDVKQCRELEDFKMLVGFLKEKSVDCTFIILPLNPYYYEGLAAGTEVVTEITSVLETNEIPYLNLYVESKEGYDPAILKDVMHVGDYGWIRINQFLLEHYYD